MSILRDIIDISTDLGNSDAMPKYNKKYSAAVEARKGIMQFPLLVSRTVSLEETTMIAKAVERQMVSFLRVITSINSVTDAKSIENYIKRYHQNFKFNNLGDAIGESTTQLEKTNILMRYQSVNPDYLDRARNIEKSLVGLSGYISAFKNPDSEVVDVRDLDTDELAFVTNSVEEENPEMRKSICRGNMGITLIDEKNKKIKSVVIGKDFITENLEIISTLDCPLKEEDRGINICSKTADAHLQELCSESVRQMRNFKGLRDEKLNDIFTSQSATTVYGMKQKRFNLNEADLARVSTNPVGPAPTVERDDKKFTTVLDNQLSDNDSKKANELVPTMMHIKTYFKTNDNELQAVDYMIGVKAVVHPVESDSMINNLEKGTKKGKKLFNFLKFTTGEISFFKDFIFAVNSTKEEVVSKYNDSPWWSMLTRRRKRSKILQAVNAKSQLVPNTTIVISMEEANLLKDKYKVDVLNVKTIRDLCEEYFLLGFIVLDSSIEVAHLYFDGERDYSELSYSALERENSNQARDVKNIMQMLGKM